MNKFYILISALLLSIAAKGQGLTTSQNYILTTTYTAADGTSKIQDVDYYDGLGGISQKISIGASPDGKSILTPIYYDAIKRQSQQYLPYAVSGSGTYVTPQSAISAQKAFYNAKYGGNNGYSYTESVYEASPLNRKNGAWNVGNVYRTNGKKSTFTYETNTANEVMRFKVNSSGNLIRSGFHIANTLHKNSVTNEDGTTTLRYTDNLDHVVLERIVDGSINHDTYYVYDNRGNLCYVLPPKLVDLKTSTNASLSDTDTNMDALAYIYKYDDRNRRIVKKIPGAREVFMIYDPMDRLILTQDGNMKESGKWLYTVYDNLHRPVRQNLIRPINPDDISPGFDLRDIAALYNNYAFPYPTTQSESWVLQFPLNPDEIGLNFESYVLSETRYGGYNYLAPTITSELDFVEVPDVVSSTDVSDNQTGLKTYEKVAVLDGSELTSTPTYVERKFYYDYKGRVIQTVEKNHLGSISRYSTKYDFTGNILANYEQHLHQGVSLEDVTVTSGYYEPVLEFTYVCLDLSKSIDFSAVDPANLYFTQNSVLSKYYIGTTHGIRESAIADFFYIPFDETDPNPDYTILQIILLTQSIWMV